MFIYYSAINCSAKTAGVRLVGIRCDQCRCEYCYQLERVGSGLSSAHYGIGKENLEQTALESAEADLKKQLEREADLVPCPECGWINDELIEGYRKSQHQELLGCAGVLALCVVPLSLIVAWFISIGPPTDRFVLPWFQIWIPLFFLALVASMYPLQLWLRSRIQPNHNYPAPPEIPAKTPPALYFDEATGTLTPAKLRVTPNRKGSPIGTDSDATTVESRPPV